MDEKLAADLTSSRRMKQLKSTCFKVFAFLLFYLVQVDMRQPQESDFYDQVLNILPTFIHHMYISQNFIFMHY